jgi:hypothetical protein
MTSPQPSPTLVCSPRSSFQYLFLIPCHVDAEKPEEWDDEEDGDWIAPTVPNPKCTEAPGCGEWKRPFKANPEYKGKWYAPMIDNPAYKGEWAPRKIANPDFFEDLTPVKTLGKIVRCVFQ